MLKKTIFHVNGILFGYPKPSRIMDGLTMKKISVVYSANVTRPRMVFKQWNVAVKTVMPEDMVSDHGSWMLHIMCERGILIAQIADHEHNEAVQHIRAYKEKMFNKSNFDTIKTINQ